LILLIYPPVAKPCEPPAGIARLSGMLGSLGIEHRLLDANREGILHLLRMPVPPEKKRDIWTQRAVRNLEQNLSSMRDPALYRHVDRYARAVRDIGRVLIRSAPPETTVGLTNYEQKGLSPIRSEDLKHAAEKPEINPFYPYFRSRLDQLFQEKAPSVVGISLSYLSQAFCAFSIIGYLKRTFPEVKIILGGGLVTSWANNLQGRNPFSGLADHLVAGPGEYQLLSLLGLSAEGEKIWRPYYHALPLDGYLSPGFILPYSAAAGCYWKRCTFCPENAEDNLYVPVPPSQVLADIKDIAETTNPALIHLLDNAISPALLEALSATRQSAPWYGFARISPRLTDPSFCRELKQSGCVMLKLGIESGDQRVLDALQKGIRVETASAVLKNLKNSGIATYVYLMFGTPPETEAGARKTLEFTVQHRDSIDFLNLAIFNMPVSMGNAPEVETREFYEGDLSLYTDFIHPAGWDRKRVRMFIENTFKKHPAVSAILKNDPPVFTSNHAPFFVKERARR
jgi:radical SAM superfamily enzyme YgiQ (UPF0313 family)